MDNAPTLHKILSLTAAAGVVCPRGFYAETAEDALGYVLEALRGCILPRELAFSIDDALALRVLADGGRVLRVLSSVDDAAQAVSHRTLDADNEEDLTQLGDLLRALFQGEERITVRSTTPEDVPDDTHTGLSAVALQASLGIVPLAPDLPSRRDNLLAATEEFLIGTYTPNGTPDFFRDGVAFPEEFLELLDRLLGPDGPVGRVSQHDVLLLPNEVGFPADLGLMHGEDGPIALIFDPGSAADVARFWTDLPRMSARTP